jgi:hypothetical protein
MKLARIAIGSRGVWTALVRATSVCAIRNFAHRGAHGDDHDDRDLPRTVSGASAFAASAKLEACIITPSETRPTRPSMPKKTQGQNGRLSATWNAQQ